MNELYQAIKNKLQDLLNTRFSGESKTKRVINTNYKGDELICACPICGDSSRDIFKKRMHIYTDSMAVKCYNCGFWGSVRQMFYKCGQPLDSKFGKILEGVFKDNIQQKVQLSETGNISKNDTLLDKIQNARNALFNIAVPTTNLLSIGFIPLGNSLPFTKYMMDRGYKYMTDAYKMQIVGDTTKGGPSQLNAVFSQGQMRILGTSTRIIDENASQRYFFRYLTSLSHRVTRDMQDILDTYRTYVTANNILNVNYNTVITCCEGFFDAAFIDNSISTGGTGNMGGVINLFKDDQEHIRFLLDDDDTGNAAAMSLIRKGFTVFSWSQYKAWAKHDLDLDLSKCKDVTDVIKAAMKVGDETVRLCIDTMQKYNMYNTSSIEAMKDMLFR